jgi:opacity protein-like surface antigen
MKYLLFTIILVVILIFITSFVQAQEFHPYIGMGVSSFTMDSGIAGSSTAGGGFVNFGIDSKIVGAELRMGRTGDASVNYKGVNISYGLDTFFSLLGKLNFSPTDPLRLYAIVGYTTAYSRASATVAGQKITASGTASSGSYGAGLDYRIQDHLLIGGEWMAYALDVSGIAINLKYEF